MLEDEQRAEREALDRLEAGIGAGSRAAGGVENTIEALNERRVETLLLDSAFEGKIQRCPNCGLLVLGSDGRCPADESGLERVDHLREAVVEAALAQDAAVIVVHHYEDLGPLGGIGAVLRF